MGNAIVVEPSKKQSGFSRLCNAIFSFFACVGESILKFPNGVFYTVLVILCVFIPLFALFLLIALLCGNCRRQSHGF
jgi:hypothetical protein